MKRPLKPRDKITQRMTHDGLTLDNQTTGENVNVSSREAEQEYTAEPGGTAEKALERADQLHSRHVRQRRDGACGHLLSVRGQRYAGGRGRLRRDGGRLAA